MNFRRLPFQFTTTDPAERQRELERRFGLPTNRDMYVDAVNPLSMGSLPRESNISASSPRLQHRVPIFVDGYDQPIHSSVDSTAPTSENKKPNVRVIPIEVEGADNRPARHRTFSGPARTTNGHGDERPPQINASSLLKRSVEDFSKSSATGPRVHTIPIQVESSNKSTKIPKFEKSAAEPSQAKQVNGCGTVSETFPKSSAEVDNKPEGPLNGIENSLKKIESVLEQLKTYEAEVQRFSGTTKEKQYRYLDEMLTQCMIKLDDVDTMGNDGVRSARKNAVKKIQAQLDLLESKANAAVSSSVPESSTVKEPVETKELTSRESSLGIQELEEVKRDQSQKDVGMEDKAETSHDSSLEIQELDKKQRDQSQNDAGMEDEATPSHDSNLETQEIEVKRDECGNDVGMEDESRDSNPEIGEDVEMAEPNDGDLVETGQGSESLSRVNEDLVPVVSISNKSEVDSDVHENAGEQILNATLEDAEMKDVQSTTLVDLKEENSCSSQLKDNCERDVNMAESSVCNNDIVASQGAVKEETACSELCDSIKE